MEGVTFLNEGVHQVQLPNGASINVYASPYTPEFCDWGFPYEKPEDCFNTPATKLADAKYITRYPVPGQDSQAPIDIIITHGPPYGRLDRTSGGDFVGCPHLLRAVMRARPLLHCFGHIHEGWGAEIANWTSDVDKVAIDTTTIQDWKDGKWRDGVAAQQGIAAVSIDQDATLDQHAASLDLSSSGKAISQGEQTAFVNAAIMDVTYKPLNAPWLVDVDLPTKR